MKTFFDALVNEKKNGGGVLVTKFFDTFYDALPRCAQSNNDKARLSLYHFPQQLTFDQTNPH